MEILICPNCAEVRVATEGNMRMDEEWRKFNKHCECAKCYLPCMDYKRYKLPEIKQLPWPIFK